MLWFILPSCKLAKKGIILFWNIVCLLVVLEFEPMSLLELRHQRLNLHFKNRGLARWPCGGGTWFVSGRVHCVEAGRGVLVCSQIGKPFISSKLWRFRQEIIWPSSKNSLLWSFDPMGWFKALVRKARTLFPPNPPAPRSGDENGG